MILQGKTVIVSGVGRGMGGKLSAQAAKEGARVALVARSTEYVGSVAAEIRAAGGEAVTIRADVSKKEDCLRVAAETQQAFGPIWGLINSAYRPGNFLPFEDADLNDWRESFGVTLFGSLQMVQAVLPSMKANGGGSIVNICTMEMRRPIAEHGSYGVPKAALQASTRQLALELGKYNIRVNNAIPGWMWGVPVENFMTGVAKEQKTSLDALLAPIAAKIPLGRVPPDGECARSVLMLLSDYNSQVTGASLDINGGDFLAL